ncbi:pectinacetylesterase [Leptospira perolatii]|uniref:Pectinacetylesterase n=1 Tax=Leptospira perolatii TaxID=2023191 RepID=A0A2M9ZJI6_9LEPT|nr:pectin acetylesterase-family hydrolase [Leptospira perolatii]PJZ68861.1 pectinacetylesterase [Leptospira perolatii]PJZ72192.1 pectinacetylesterase [Leptospira perolatii]
MNYKSIILGTLVLSVLSFTNCKTEKKDDDKLLLLAAVLYSPYEKIVPTPGTITIPNTGGAYTGRSFTPTCSGAPGNTDFYFFRKKVADNNKKILINFMGGGACWSKYNCFGENTTTYFNMLNQLPDIFVNIAFKGIMNSAAPRNPFLAYDVIFIPYCTGDLHIGSADAVYNDPTNGNSPTTIKHRGHENVLSVLKYIQDNYTGLTDVFVTGQSAGGYGAILNYPHVRETVHGINASVKVNMLSDASQGVVQTIFYSNVVKNLWGADQNLPTWVTNITSGYLTGTPSLVDFFDKVARFYTADQFAQYTSLYDGNQRFFMNVMNIIDGLPAYTDAATTDPYDSSKTYSTLFGDSDASSVADGSPTIPTFGQNCFWPKQMLSDLATISGGGAIIDSNYKIYIAPGDVHTITTNDDMYSLSTGGVDFTTWLANHRDGNHLAAAPDYETCTKHGHLFSSKDCSASNFNKSVINNALGHATSDQAYAASLKDMTQACPDGSMQPPN